MHEWISVDLLGKGAVAHNIAEYFRDAIEVALLEARWSDVPELSDELRKFSDEELPWIEFWAARGEVLAEFGSGHRNAEAGRKVKELISTAERAQLKSALPALQEVRSELD